MKKDIHEEIFNVYKQFGEVVEMGELQKLIPSRLSRQNWRKAIKRTQVIYKSRWHEIYDIKTGVVHEEPPKSQPVEESALDPLLALRRVKRKKEEEHE